MQHYSNLFLNFSKVFIRFISFRRHSDEGMGGDAKRCTLEYIQRSYLLVSYLLSDSLIIIK